MTQQAMVDLITDVYTWFNQIADPNFPLIPKDFHRHFSPDFVMQMNREIICTDHQSLFQHFEDFRQSGSVFSVALPFEALIHAPDSHTCTVRFNIIVTHPNQSQSHMSAMALWYLAPDGRLARVNEVVAVE